MAWISGNYALNQSQMDNNAREFYAAMSGYGFTVNAIAGMLGNAWRESTVNPGVWQNYKVNYNMGFGLFQWTPASKLIDWAKQNGMDPASGDAQVVRVMYEYRNGVQYYKTTKYPLTFPQFAKSHESPEYLAEVFLANYERAAAETADLPGRKKWARYFYDLLQGGEPP